LRKCLRHFPAIGLFWLYSACSAFAGGVSFAGTLESFVVNESSIALSILPTVPNEPIITEVLADTFRAKDCESYTFWIYDAKHGTLAGRFLGYDIRDQVDPLLGSFESLKASGAEVVLYFIAQFGDLTQISDCEFVSIHTSQTFADIENGAPSINLGY